MSQYIEHTKREREQVVRRLRDNPDFQLYLALTNVIEAYGQGSAPVSVKISPHYPPAENTLLSQFSEEPTKSIRSGTKLARIEAIAKEVIDANNDAATMNQIHEKLTKNEIIVTKPALSAYLSGFRKTSGFVNNKDKGTWGYKGVLG